MSQIIPALQISDLVYHYKSQWSWARSIGLDQISLAVNEGESFGFLGHNGAGKTTTIKCILGLLRPSTGSIKIFGVDSRLSAARNGVGYVAEHPYFYDHLTVSEIIEMYAILAGVPRREAPRSVAVAIERLGLGSRARSPMRTLSKGLTQRVAMAQAIAAHPKLLILDEPFSGLDPLGRKEFIDLIFELKRGGTTIFISSHILSDVEHLCDRASILVGGTLRAIFDLRNPPPELVGGYYELRVAEFGKIKAELITGSMEHRDQQTLLSIRFSERAEAERALAAAVRGGARVESFEFLRNSLQDLFIELTSSAAGPN